MLFMYFMVNFRVAVNSYLCFCFEHLNFEHSVLGVSN